MNILIITWILHIIYYYLYWGAFFQLGFMSLNDFTSYADEIANSLPPELFQHLNGGIVVEPFSKEDGDYLLMGEYIEDPGLGNMVLLYYGSFRELLGEASINEWKEEIEETLIHELRHHIESLAGIDDLSYEETLETEGDNRA